MIPESVANTWGTRTMKFVIAYLLLTLALFTVAGWGLGTGLGEEWLPKTVRIALFSGLAGGFGGVFYCLRGVYLSASVRNDWDDRWVVWHLLRPIVSFLSGLASYIFVRAGLLLLDADTTETQSSFGLLAIAFVAGLNVDRFIEKIEEIASNVWGIRKSRTAERSAKKEGD